MPSLIYVFNQLIRCRRKPTVYYLFAYFKLMYLISQLDAIVRPLVNYLFIDLPPHADFLFVHRQWHERKHLEVAWTIVSGRNR